MTDIVKITEKQHIAETLKKISDTNGIYCVTWNNIQGLWSDFHFAVDKTNSLILLGKDQNDEAIPPITISMESISNIQLNLDYGDLTIFYHPTAFEDAFNTPKQEYRDLYVTALNSSQEIHLSIKRSYHFENVGVVQSYKNSMATAGSDF
jgi:hypothetical protein